MELKLFSSFGFLTIFAVMAFPALLYAAEDRCSESGHTRLWAQRVSGTDLAQAFLKEKRIPRVSRIAVVDSGFDRRQLASLARNSRLRIVPLNSDARGDVSDTNGHGTAVVALIKGANGIGGSTGSRLTLYANGPGAPTRVAEAVLRACREGAQIISVSAGGDNEIASFLQLPQSFFFNDSVVREIEQRGCLLVHSAGNRGARIQIQAREFEFEIGATDPLSQISQFSSRGEFSMPGQRVTTLRSSGKPDSAERLYCGPSEELVSGTSFAAPIFSDHLALLRDVLINSSAFRLMPQAQQTGLLREITQASRIGNVVNAYLAVRIADAWTRAPRSSVAELKNRISNQCQLTYRASDVWAQQILCEDNNSRLGFAASLENSGDLEGAAYWLNAVRERAGRTQLNAPFPLARLRADLARGSSLPQIARWMNYYSLRQDFSSADEELARSELNEAAVRTLENLEQLIPQLRSAVFSEEFRKTVLFVLETKKPQNIDLLRRLVGALRVDQYSQNALLHLLIKGSKDKTIAAPEIKVLLDDLLGQPLSAEGVQLAIKILKHADLDYETKNIYLNRILALEGAPRNVCTELSLLGLEGDRASNTELERWLSTLRTILANKACGPNEADGIALALFSVHEDFAATNRAEANEILNTLDHKLADRPDSSGRALVDWIRQSFISKGSHLGERSFDRAAGSSGTTSPAIGAQ